MVKKELKYVCEQAIVIYIPPSISSFTPYCLAAMLERELTLSSDGQSPSMSWSQKVVLATNTSFW